MPCHGGTWLLLLLAAQHTILISAASISSTNPPLSSSTEPIILSTHESTSSTVETTDQPTTTQATSRTAMESSTALSTEQGIVTLTSNIPSVSQNGRATSRKLSKTGSLSSTNKIVSKLSIVKGETVTAGIIQGKVSLMTSTSKPKISTSTTQTSTLSSTSAEVLSTTKTTVPPYHEENVVSEPEYYQEKVNSLGCRMLPLPPRASIWKANQTHELNLPNQVKMLFLCFSSSFTTLHIPMYKGCPQSLYPSPTITNITTKNLEKLWDVFPFRGILF